MPEDTSQKLLNIVKALKAVGNSQVVPDADSADSGAGIAARNQNIDEYRAAGNAPLIPNVPQEEEELIPMAKTRDNMKGASSAPAPQKSVPGQTRKNIFGRQVPVIEQPVESGLGKIQLDKVNPSALYGSIMGEKRIDTKPMLEPLGSAKGGMLGKVPRYQEGTTDAGDFAHYGIIDPHEAIIPADQNPYIMQSSENPDSMPKVRGVTSPDEAAGARAKGGSNNDEQQPTVAKGGSDWDAQRLIDEGPARKPIAPQGMMQPIVSKGMIQPVSPKSMMQRQLVDQDQEQAARTGDLVELGKSAINKKILDSAANPEGGMAKINMLGEPSAPMYGGPAKTSIAPGQLIPNHELIQDVNSYAKTPEVRDAAKVQYFQKHAALKQAVANANNETDRAVAQQNLLALEQQKPWGSEGNHPGMLGKIAHGFAKAGNIAGNIVEPGVMSLIPGTDLNRERETRIAGAQERQGVENQESQARTAEDQARAGLQKAQTNAMGQPKPKEEEWSVVPGLQGPNGEPVQQEKNSGQLRVGNLPGVTTKPKTGAEAPANDEQLAEYGSQIPALTPFLNSEERLAYAFPKGYKPSVGEIAQMKKDAAAANSAALAGNREARAAALDKQKANKKSQEEDVIEKAAQSIQSMKREDLSPLKDIASLRGDQRLLIYQRAKELNPNFNTAEVQRKVKMLDAFENGKDGQNLQSFGTFFEHAGNLSEAINNLRNFKGGAELLNKPWNWFENHTGDPRVVQFMAAAEPVKKEFESFLLNNRALYESDRKGMDEIVNGNMSPAKLQAALKTLGHTAVARYTEMNGRFKKTMGAGIEDTIGPMTPEAYNAAGQIGIDRIGNRALRNGKQGYGWYVTEGK